MSPPRASTLLLALSLAAPAWAGPEPRRLDPAEAGARLELRQQKRALQDSRRASAPELPARPGEPKAVSCGAPCDTGQLLIEQAFHDVLLDCQTGAFGIRTGGSHPATAAAGARQDLLFDAAADRAVGGHAAIYVHEDMAFFDAPGGRQACSFDPPDTPAEPNSLGLEQEWTLTPRMDLDLRVRHELVAFGSGPDDAGVRMSLTVTNESATESATVGLRWWLDPAIALDDGPSVTTLTCDPPQQLATWTEEHEFPPAEVEDFLLLTNDDVFGTEPVIEYVIGTSAVTDFPNTVTPDRLVLARWANAPDDPPPPWDYTVFEGDPTGDDGVLLISHGHDPADGSLLGPGESVTLSTLMLTRCDRMPGGCVPPSMSAFVAGTPACPGEQLTFSGSLDAPGLGAYTYTWTFGDGSPPVQVADPTVAVFHAYDGPDIYRARLSASDGADPGCSSVATVDVEVLAGPAPSGRLFDELRVRREGDDVLLDWPGSPVAPPSFAALRSDDRQAVRTDADWLLADRIAWGPAETATDAGAVGSGALRLYKVFPAEPDCGQPVTPPDLLSWRELLRDELETDSGWIVNPDGTDDATTGIWVREEPEGTNFQVDEDRTPDPGALAWVTGNLVGADDGDDDVDEGCTTLQSPAWDMTGRGALRLSYWRSWDIGATADDVFLVELSNDGGTNWLALETIDAPTGGWARQSVLLPPLLAEPPGEILLRFTACDTGFGSFIEAAVDDVLIEEVF